MTIPFDNKHTLRRDARPCLPLGALRKELGLDDGGDTFELRQRLLDLAAKCDARFSPDAAFFLPEDDKGLAYTWRELKCKLSWVAEDLLMEPTLQISSEKDPKEPQLLAALSKKCEELHELTNHKAGAWEGTIPEKIEFARQRVSKGAQVSPEERQLLFMCQHQLRKFQEGKRAFISGPELELINDFWKFKEEFESFTLPRQPQREPGPQADPEQLGRSSFKWTLKNGLMLPTLNSRYVNSTVLDRSHHYFRDLIEKNETNLKAAGIFERYFNGELTQTQAIGMIRAEHPKFDLDFHLARDVFDRPSSVEQLRGRSLANIEILSRFLLAAIGDSDGRKERLMATVKELQVVYPPPADLVSVHRPKK